MQLRPLGLPPKLRDMPVIPKNAVPAKDGISNLFISSALPQAVKIAIRISGHYGVSWREDEDSSGLIAGLQSFALASFFRFQQNPLDEMSFQHGMLHAPQGDGHGLTILLYRGHVLFACSVRSVGN